MDGQVDPRAGPGSTGSHNRRNHRAAAQDWFGEQRTPTEISHTVDKFFERPYIERSAGAGKTPQSLTMLPGSSNLTHRSPPSAPPVSNNDYGHKEGQWERRGSYPGAGRGNPNSYRTHHSSAPASHVGHHARSEDRRHPYIDNGNPSTPNNSSTSINASLDPRRIGRTNTSKPLSLNTEQQNSPGQQESSGRHSGSQTPMTPQSLGPSHDERIKELTAVLDEFSSHVTTMASLTTQRDIAEKEYKKREQDYQMSRKYHAAFATLAEQQENSKVKAHKKFEELDQKLKNHIAAREQLSTAIASKVISHSNSKDAASLKRIESRFQELTKRVNNTFSEIGQIRALQNQVTSCEKFLNTIQDELEGVRPVIAFVDSLVPRLDKLENRVDGFPDLRMELSKIRDELKPISKAIDKAMANMERLSQTVDGNEHGLVQTVEKLKAQGPKYLLLFKELDDKQDRADTELDQHHTRILALEARINADTDQTRPEAQSGSTADQAVSADVARLEANLELFRAEQEARDGMVSEDMEKTEERVKKLESAYKNFTAEIEQINGWIDDRSQERASIVDKRPSLNGEVEDEAKPALNSISTSNGVPSNPETDQEVKKIKDELQQQQVWQSDIRHQMDGFRYSIEVLDMRFNKLTTEQLARFMVGQMSKIYPQASAIMASFDQCRQYQEFAQTKIQELSDRLEKISSEQQQQREYVMMIPPTTRPTTNGPMHDDTYSKAETDRMIGELRNHVLEMIDLSKNTAQQMNEVRLRVDSLWESTAKEFGTLFVQVEALKEQQQQQEGNDGGSNAGAGPTTRPTSERTSAGPGPAHTGPARKPSTTATNTPVSYSHSPPTRHQSVSNTNTSKKSTPAKAGGKKRGRKRKRGVVSDSESDWQERVMDHDNDDGGSGSD